MIDHDHTTIACRRGMHSLCAELGGPNPFGAHCTCPCHESWRHSRACQERDHAACARLRHHGIGHNCGCPCHERRQSA